MKSPAAPNWSRRRVLRTVFCSSAMLGLNVNRSASAAVAAEAGDQHWLMIGDFGSQEPAQTAVAGGLKAYAQGLGVKPSGLLLLGDNFYKKTEGWSPTSARWKTGFEEMYPKDVFDCPCPAVLGNHDYHDNVGGEQVQLAYAKQGGTRWHMPAKWYRYDTPLITFLCIDTNLKSTSGSEKGGKVQSSLNPQEEKDQLAWLKAELKKSRTTPWLIVVGHHPVYSNGVHGDSKQLVKEYAPLFQEHGVHLYLCGHDHDMQHLELEGQKTSYILSGGGGARVRELKNKDRQMPYGVNIYGFTHLQANKDRLLVRHMDANRNQVHAFEKKPDYSFVAV